MPTYYSDIQNGQRIRMDVTWTQDIAANTSTITVAQYQEALSGNVADSTWAMSTSIHDATTYTDTRYRSFTAGNLYHISTSSRTISHNSVGALQVGVATRSNTGSTSFFRQTLSVMITLPTIPRATTPTWSGNFVAGIAKVISLPRASSGFVHDLAIRYWPGSEQQTIATGVGESFTWTPELELLEHSPNAAAGVGVMYVTTKQGSTVIGTKSASFTLEAASDVVPVVTGVAWDDANPVVKAHIGAFVQGLSLITGTVTAAGVYGSTITSRRVRIGDTLVGEGVPIQITGSGAVEAVGEATDSRGRVGSLPAGFTVLAYEPPRIGVHGWQVRRADAAGQISDLGQYLRVDLHAVASSLVAGAEKNALKIATRTRQVGEAWTARNTISPGLVYDDHFLITGGDVFLVSESYEVEISLSDETGAPATRLVVTVPTATVALDLNGTQVGVGKYHERGALDVGGDGYATTWRADSGVYAGGAILCPIGSILEWPAASAPAGWLLCQGQAVSRTQYAGLFALIGSTYGAGDGGTTFNLPDRRGRVGVGLSADSEFNQLGKTFGTKTHTLTINELPVFSGTSGGAQAGAAQGSFTGVPIRQQYGGGAAHNNIQPSIAMNYIIRAL